MGLCFDDLPVEIIHSVLEYVLDSSPRTAKALSLVNKCLLEAVNVCRSRRRIITLDKDGKIDGIARTSPSIFDNTNYLTIEASKNSRVPFSDTAVIVELIETIKNLKILIWNAGPIPVEILSRLRTFHPTCALRIFKWWRFDHLLNHLDQSEIALSKFENLTHFRFINGDDGFGRVIDAPYAWEVFREIVAMSESLQLASFLVNFKFRAPEDQEWNGIVLTSSGQVNSSFKVRHLKRKPLKSLTIDCPDFRLSSATLHELGRFTNLSAIEYLKVSRGRPQLDYFQTAPALLPNLKHISLNFAHFSSDLRAAAKDYLLTCSPAKTLSLWAWNAVVPLQELLERHGQSLEVLQLHMKDSWFKDDSEALHAEGIQLIDNSCPCLVDLTIDLDIDMDKSGDTPPWILKVAPEEMKALKELVGKRPDVRNIQIYYSTEKLADLLGLIEDESDESVEYDPDTEINEENDEDDGRETDDNGPETEYWDAGKEQHIEYLRRTELLPTVELYATALWKELFSQSRIGGRLLELKFGDWEGGNWAGDPREDLTTFCEVRPNERDDQLGQCVVRTRCRYSAEPRGV